VVVEVGVPQDDEDDDRVGEDPEADEDAPGRARRDPVAEGTEEEVRRGPDDGEDRPGERRRAGDPGEADELLPGVVLQGHRERHRPDGDEKEPDEGPHDAEDRDRLLLRPLRSGHRPHEVAGGGEDDSHDPPLEETRGAERSEDPAEEHGRPHTEEDPPDAPRRHPAADAVHGQGGGQQHDDDAHAHPDPHHLLGGEGLDHEELDVEGDGLPATSLPEDEAEDAAVGEEHHRERHQAHHRARRRREEVLPEPQEGPAGGRLRRQLHDLGGRVHGHLNAPRA
jgi:hypothetical protein